MKNKSHKFILGLILIVTLSSCGIFFHRNYEPLARFCYLDTNSKMIYYNTSKTRTGIIRIEINIISFDNKFISKYYQKNYSPALFTFNLSSLDTLFLKENYLMIKIWDTSPILEDYSIKISPDDWNKKKLIYSNYNYR